MYNPRVVMVQYTVPSLVVQVQYTVQSLGNHGTVHCTILGWSRLRYSTLYDPWVVHVQYTVPSFDSSGPVHCTILGCSRYSTQCLHLIAQDQCTVLSMGSPGTEHCHLWIVLVQYTVPSLGIPGTLHQGYIFSSARKILSPTL